MVIYREHHQGLGESITRTAQGRLMMLMQQISGAKSVFERALRGFEAAGHNEGLVETHRWLATLTKKLGGGEMKHYKKAMAIQRAMKQRGNKSDVLYTGSLQFY